MYTVGHSGITVIIDLLISKSAPTDYTSKSLVIMFEPDEAEKVVIIQLEDDNVYEGAETFTAMLISNSTNVNIANFSESTIIILDEEDCKLDLIIIINCCDKNNFYSINFKLFFNYISDHGWI